MKKKFLNIIINLIIVTLLISCIISISKVLIYKQKTTKSKHQFDTLSNIIHNKTEYELDNKYNNNHKNIVNLMEKNKNIAGWIYLDNTYIDYPVMNSDYYLNRDFNGNYSINGTPFIDKKSSINPRSDVFIIHGHNMNDGSMFNNIMKYKDKEFFENNREIVFYSYDNVELYNIFSIISLNINDEIDNKIYSYSNFDTSDTFNEFLNIIERKSIFKTNETIDINSDIIMLSTCEKNNDDERIILIGKKFTK